jgi:hypothetical protein
MCRVRTGSSGYARRWRPQHSVHGRRDRFGVLRFDHSTGDAFRPHLAAYRRLELAITSALAVGRLFVRMCCDRSLWLMAAIAGQAAAVLSLVVRRCCAQAPLIPSSTAAAPPKRRFRPLPIIAAITACPLSVGDLCPSPITPTPRLLLSTYFSMTGWCFPS